MADDGHDPAIGIERLVVALDRPFHELSLHACHQFDVAHPAAFVRLCVVTTHKGFHSYRPLPIARERAYPTVRGGLP